MATALPTTEQKLKQALSQWQHWDSSEPLAAAPRVERQLSAGLSNHSWLVSVATRQFVLRLDDLDPKRLGLSRAAEWRAHHTAYDKQLAPRPVYFNPELGALVTEFCASTTDSEANISLMDIANLLRNIHELPGVKFRLKPLDRAHHYLGQLGRERPPAEFIAACERAATAELRLCHNDLLAANRLASADGLRAIDWEYAAMGNPWYDLAVICEGDQLSERQCQELARCYLQQEPLAAQQTQLADNRLIYRHLSHWWQQLTGL